MSLSDFTSGRTAKEVQWEREQTMILLKRAEHEKTEAFLSVLRAFGAEIPKGEELFQAFFSDQKRGGGR